MQDESAQENSKGTEAWADALACPACLGELKIASDRVACASCGRAYPIEDGIPVLITERAIVPGSR